MSRTPEELAARNFAGVKEYVKAEVKKHGLWATERQFDLCTETIIEGNDPKWRDGAVTMFINFLALDYE